MSTTTARVTGEARRGDLVAVVITSHDYVIGQCATERTSVSLAVVTSVTRLGVAKTATRVDGGTLDLTRPDARRRVLVVPRESIDLDAVSAAYNARRYPSAPHSTMVPPFDSADEARTFLTPFRT